MQYQRAPLPQEYPSLHAFHDAHAHDGVHDGHDHEYVLLRDCGHGDDVRAYDLQILPRKHGHENVHALLHGYGDGRDLFRGCDRDHGDDRGHHGCDRDHEGIPYRGHGFHVPHPE